MSQSGQQPQQSNGAATGAPPPHTNKGIVKQVSIKFKLILNLVVSGLFNIHTFVPSGRSQWSSHFPLPATPSPSSLVLGLSQKRRSRGRGYPSPQPQNTNLIPRFNILTSSFPCPFAFSPLPPSSLLPLPLSLLSFFCLFSSSLCLCFVHLFRLSLSLLYTL